MACDPCFRTVHQTASQTAALQRRLWSPVSTCPGLAGMMPACGGPPSGFAMHCRSMCRGSVAVPANSRNKPRATAPSVCQAPGKAAPVEAHSDGRRLCTENARISARRSLNPRRRAPRGGREVMTKFLSPLGLADWALSGALAASGHFAVVLTAAHPQHGKAGLVQTFPA